MTLPFSSVPPASYTGVGVVPTPLNVVSEIATSNTVVFPVLVTVYV